MKNLMYNPFSGELWEGLIYSVDVDEAIKHLEKAGYNVEKISNTGFVIILLPDYDDGIFSNYLASPYVDKKIPKLLQLTNNLGYMATLIRYYSYTDTGKNIISKKYSPSLLRNAVLDDMPNKIWMTFNKKFDQIVNNKDLPPAIYHLTEKKYINSIKNIGLKPSAKEKIKSHKRRIYFCPSRDDVKILSHHPKFKDSDIVVVIETDTLKDVVFYYDPDFADRGIYTHDNISKEHIIDIFPVEKLE